MNHAELICGQCPLSECSEDSLWCLFRFVTNPNDEQKRLLPIIEKRETRKKERKEYFRKRYQDNRPEMLAKANERHARKRQEQV